MALKEAKSRNKVAQAGLSTPHFATTGLFLADTISYMDLLRPFTKHPASVGETYYEHALRASKFGSRMLTAGAACLIHALLPFLFVHTASEALRDLHAKLPKLQVDNIEPWWHNRY